MNPRTPERYGARVIGYTMSAAYIIILMLYSFVL